MDNHLFFTSLSLGSQVKVLLFPIQRMMILNGEEINLELNLNPDARPATTPEHENEAPPVQDQIIVLNLVPTVEQDDLMEPVQQEDLMAMNTMAQ
jgi:hypothetical protein